MNLVSKTILTALKSALLSSALVGVALIGLHPREIADTLPFLSIVFLITLVLSSIGIVISIFPFYFFAIKKHPLITISKKYFPIYAITIFLSCIKIAINDGAIEIIMILSITYITAMFAWMWFFKPELNEK